MNLQDSRLEIAAAARLMQTTPLNILMHIKRGLLKGSEQDGVWLIERASLEALLASPGGGTANVVCTGGCTGKSTCGSQCG